MKYINKKLTIENVKVKILLKNLVHQLIATHIINLKKILITLKEVLNHFLH